MDLVLSTVVEDRFSLGESPVWDAANNRIYWVDILHGVLHWFNFTDRSKHQFEVFQKIGCVALAGPNLLIAALEKGFYYLDVSNRAIIRITEAPNEPQGNRFNDGKCDAAGRFWTGTMSEEGLPQQGKLYMLGSSLVPEAKLTGVGCSNGLAWSEDNSTMYYIDSLSYQVIAFDFDLDSGRISERRTVTKFTKRQGIPDGMTIDSQGALWIAMWGQGNVSRLDPESGQVLFQIKLPVSQVSSCCFGGTGLSELFVTTASIGLSVRQKQVQPLAGCTFCIKNTGYTGFSSQRFIALQ